MLTLLAPLILAAISGLAYLAVKHPNIYEKLFGKVYAISAMAFLGMMVWTGAVSTGFSAVQSFIPTEKQVAAKAAADAITLPLHWVLLTQLATMALLFFLSWLARQVAQDGQAGQNRDA